ncbi:MAG: single-stranded DNA-binding protein [Treponema sp.]|nr:single-stranded DNA-binding protein [Treponema sp.]
MSDLNDVKLFGRVVRDAELRHSGDNHSFALFSIAVNRSIKNANGEWESKADFFSMAIYDNYAEKMSQKLKKGQKVIIQGFLKQNHWEKDGEKRSEIGIGVKSIQLIFDSKKNDNQTLEETAPQEEIENTSYQFTEEQQAEMYVTESEIYSGDVF